jgi:hypothetical protein
MRRPDSTAGCGWGKVAHMAETGAINRAAGHAATWITLGSAAMGTLTWLAGKVEWIASQGWPAIVLFALILVVSLAIAGSLVAYVLHLWLKPHPAAAGPVGDTLVAHGHLGPMPTKAEQALIASKAFASSLYVGQVLVDTSHLNDGVVEFTVRGFNATGERISIKRVDGYCRFAFVVDGQIPKSEKGALAPPIVRPEPATNSVLDRTEFTIVLQQPIPRVIASEMAQILERGAIHFEFSDLFVMAESVTNSARLPMWDGVSIRRAAQGAIVSGLVRIMKAEPISLKLS